MQIYIYNIFYITYLYYMLIYDNNIYVVNKISKMI